MRLDSTAFNGRRAALAVLAVMFAYVFTVLRPLQSRVQELDESVNTSWRALAQAGLGGEGDAAAALALAERRLVEAKSMASRMTEASGRASELIALDAETLSRVSQPFSLVDYQGQRQQDTEMLARLAKESQVAIAPALLDALPQYAATRENPSLLWAELSIARHLLQSAFQARVARIQSLAVIAAADVATNSRLSEIAVDIRLDGGTPSVGRFLAMLPYRGDELRVLGVTNLVSKPALFIDRILVRKDAPEKTDNIQLELRACGVVRSP